MKKQFTVILLLLLSSMAFCQWTQVGSDINGEAADDASGNSVSLSADGSIMAVGADMNDGNGTNSGHVRVYENQAGTWVQIGQDIDGEAASSHSGISVSLSSDGSTLAIGAYFNNGVNGTESGHARVYKYQTGTWVQIGQDIDGEAAFDYSGWSVSLSNDGTVIAIGAEVNDGNGSNSGHVRVYRYQTGSWVQIGQDIDGEAADNGFGRSVSISSDGTIVAIGASSNDGNGIDSGHVRVYENQAESWVQIGHDIDGEATNDRLGSSVSISDDGLVVAIGAFFNPESAFDPSSCFVRVYENQAGEWIKIGQDIDGEAEDDRFGVSVSINADGSIVAIGAHLNDGNGTNSGHVRVYKNQSGTWTQIGLDIDGEAEGDVSGYSVCISSDGTNVAIGAIFNDDNGENSGHVRMYHFIQAVSIWTGLTNTNWNTATNWDSGLVPTASMDVEIPSLPVNQPVIGNAIVATCNNIEVAAGAELTVSSGGVLTVSGDLNNAGTIFVSSDNSGNGSLIINGSILGAGSYQVDRYLSASQWHLVSSPITAGLSGVFEGIWLRPYLESTNTFGEYIVPSNIPMTTGQGFSVWANAAETRTFSGTINHGNIGPLNAQLTGTADPNRGWNLMGNPYTSAIDWDAASGWTKTNLANSVYVWNGALAQYASYVGGAGTNGGSQYIAPGQGFFVQAIGAGASINMANGICLHNSVNFLKETSEPLDIIRISVNGNGQSDEAVIAIRETNANAYDPQTDAVKFPGSSSAPQMYTIKGDLSQLSINSVNNVSDVFGKAVYMDYAQDGQHTISWSHTLQGSTIPVLYDNLTATAIQPETPYIFTASSTDPAERFTFTEISMGIENYLTNINVWENNNILYVQNLSSSTVNNVSIYNMQGQLVMEFTSNVKDLSSLSPAIYVVKVNAERNTVVEKIIIK